MSSLDQLRLQGRARAATGTARRNIDVEQAYVTPAKARTERVDEGPENPSGAKQKSIIQVHG